MASVEEGTMVSDIEESDVDLQDPEIYPKNGMLPSKADTTGD